MPDTITIDRYLAVLRQLARAEADRWASLSPLAVILRAEGPRIEERPPGLAQAGRIAGAMTLEERRDPSSIGGPRRQGLARRCRVRPEEVDRLIRHFDRVRAVARSYQDAGIRGRLHRLLKSDPVIGWFRSRLG